MSTVASVEKRIIDSESDAQPVGGPDLFSGEVASQELQLGSKQHFVRPIRAKDVMQHVAKQLEHPTGNERLAGAHKHRNGVQAVEQKVRIELHAECAQTSFRELRRQTRSLRFTLAHLGEVRERVHTTRARLQRAAARGAGSTYGIVRLVTDAWDRIQ